MVRVIDVVIVGTLILWAIVTIASQFDPAFKRRVRWPTSVLVVLGGGLFSYIPRDVWVSYRDRSTEGELTAWTPLTTSSRNRPLSLVWAPGFWYDLHVVGITSRMIRAQTRLPAARLPANMWYRLVADLVRAQPRPQAIDARQFRVESRRWLRGQSDHRVVFTSEFTTL